MTTRVSAWLPCILVVVNTSPESTVADVTCHLPRYPERIILFWNSPSIACKSLVSHTTAQSCLCGSKTLYPVVILWRRCSFVSAGNTICLQLLVCQYWLVASWAAWRMRLGHLLSEELPMQHWSLDSEHAYKNIPTNLDSVETDYKLQCVWIIDHFRKSSNLQQVRQMKSQKPPTSHLELEPVYCKYQLNSVRWLLKLTAPIIWYLF